jgi:uncharacterized repeat protein (TIGR03803 family)
MTKLAQHRRWNWPIRVGVATAALALVVLLGRVVVMTPSAEAHADATFTLLYSFKGGTDGATPRAGLVRDAAGNLYGTTVRGGASDLGAVFKLDTTGAETVLYSFAGVPDGANPYAALVRDSAGNLYGTTLKGGSSDFGTVFRLDTTGLETVLHSFTGPDGQYPWARLVRDSAGNFYSTTKNGGSSNNCSGGCGTVFKLDTTGAETVLYNFTGGADGYYPDAGLVRDAAGNLYGTTSTGGDSFVGTVFKLDSTGAETVLHTFTTSPPDGAHPHAGLIRDAAGNLYGTTYNGGAYGDGAVFKLDATSAETVLYSFKALRDGTKPYADPLLRDAAGNLYGTTYWGGSSYSGTVFKLDTTGTKTMLHDFTGPDGQHPVAGLIRDSAGNLYGTTTDGGAFGRGTVFKISH